MKLHGPPVHVDMKACRAKVFQRLDVVDPHTRALQDLQRGVMNRIHLLSVEIAKRFQGGSFHDDCPLSMRFRR